MSRSFLLVVLLIGALLSACVSGGAESPSTEAIPAQITATAKIPEQTVPTTSYTPAPTADLAKLAAFESSVLVADGGGENETLLYPIDPESGEALPGYEPIPLGLHYVHAFSPDGETLAVVTFLSSKYSHPHTLVLLDLATWQEQVYDLDLDSYHRGIAFSPDGHRLAVLSGDVKGIVTAFDRDREAVTAQTTLDFLASRIRYTRDGRQIMLYGTAIENRFTSEEQSAGPPIAVLLEASDLSLRWSAALAGVRDGVYPNEEKKEPAADLHQPGVALYYFPGLAFAPERDVLYVVHPDEDKLTTVDFNAQEVLTVEIDPWLTWYERLLSLGAGVAHAKVAEGTDRRAVISPDGEFLYVVGRQNDLIQDGNGEWQVSSSPLGLQVIRTDDGARIAQLETDAEQVAVSPDGHYLYLLGWSGHTPRTEVLDLSTLEFVKQLDGVWLRPGFDIGGEVLLLSSEWIDGSGHHIAVADPGSLQLLNEWKSSRYLAWLSVQ